MEMKIKSIYLLFVTTFLFAVNALDTEYKIKYFGLNAALCKSSYIDTTIIVPLKDNMNYVEKIKCTKIVYEVKSTGFFDKIFPINNTYVTIVDDNYNMIYYSKKTSQPKLDNSLNTIPIEYNIYKDRKLYYAESNLTVPIDVINIFTLLYLIEKNPKYLLSKDEIILEKEGKLYNCQIILSDNQYELIFEEVNSNIGALKYTDIFTWGIFIDNSKRIIYTNQESGNIEKSLFKNKHISFRADRN